jgi:hypothetical protein
MKIKGKAKEERQAVPSSSSPPTTKLELSSSPFFV